MKTSLFQIIGTACIVLLISAFTLFPYNDFALNVKVQGMENKDLLKEGLTPAELAIMTIESNDEKVSIEKFEVVLARGTRPISVESVNGNQYDLINFSEQAKAGDRIVIEVMETSSTMPLDEKALFASIPIN
ncbi:GldM family protein [Catalinimonas niigatensis]|uniref:GldM family protein n=1 Tax=Catalinimonas niigatensis TaxID=1397264 RepID=UPI00266633C5|nr:hypothetical protein [Catalinimonas niigatensis]WPP50824.1 hypothetical protein PZB72_00250 [Catalinimonas niigatensis]